MPGNHPRRIVNDGRRPDSLFRGNVLASTGSSMTGGAVLRIERRSIRKYLPLAFLILAATSIKSVGMLAHRLQTSIDPALLK